MARLNFITLTDPFQDPYCGSVPLYHFHASVCCCGFHRVTPCCEAPLIQLCRREMVCLFGNRPGFLCLPLCMYVCVCVYNEVVGSGIQVKRYTRVRNEVFSLYGNGVRGFICTALAVCVFGSHRALKWDVENTLNVSMCRWVVFDNGGQFLFLFWSFTERQKELILVYVFLEVSVPAEVISCWHGEHSSSHCGLPQARWLERPSCDYKSYVRNPKTSLDYYSVPIDPNKEQSSSDQHTQRECDSMQQTGVHLSCTIDQLLVASLISE